jgi:hypothetical protein
MANGASLSVRTANAVFQLEPTGGGSVSKHLFHSSAVFRVNGIQPIVGILMKIRNRSAPHLLISGAYIDETPLATVCDPKDFIRGS